MTVDKTQLNRIQWYEGMLLMPQHFQQNDARIDKLLQTYLSVSISHFWGVMDISLDPTTVTNGHIDVLSLQAIFPDGTYYQMQSQDQGMLNLNFTKAFQSFEGTSQTIYVILPKDDRTSMGVSDKYRLYETNIISDQGPADTSSYLSLLQPNVSLHIGSLPSSRYTFIPIAQIHNHEGVFTLSPDFIPPQFKMLLSLPLVKNLLNMSGRIREKIAILTKRLSNQMDNHTTYKIESILKALIGGLIPFEAELKAECQHPFSVYLAACTLAGQISTVHPDGFVPNFKAYDHNNIVHSFEPVISFIDLVLSRIRESHDLQIFESSNGVFTLNLQTLPTQSDLILGAKIPRNMTFSEMIEWIQSAIIATERYIPSIREKRILGAPRSQIKTGRFLTLMPEQDLLLFSIECAVEFIDFQDTLTVFNSSDTPDKRPIELILFKPN